jgi:hypothetical protein
MPVTKEIVDTLNRGISLMIRNGQIDTPPMFLDTEAYGAHFAEENARFSAHGVPLVHPKFTLPSSPAPSPIHVSKHLLLSVIVRFTRTVHFLQIAPPVIYPTVARYYGYADKRDQKHFEINYHSLRAIVPDLCRFFFTEIPTTHARHRDDPFLFSRQALLHPDVSLAIEQFRTRAKAVFAISPETEACFDWDFPVIVGYAVSAPL